MFFMMFFLAAGILIGFLLREKDRFISLIDKMTTLAIYLLLFSLGISVGISERIMRNVGIYGAKSLILSSGAIIGSVLVSYFVYLSLFRDIEK